jgi:hypothetical protein
MNKENLAQKYIWLFLLGVGGELIGTGLLRSPERWLQFTGGLLMGLACVGLGAYIYLAVSSLRSGSLK